MKTARSPQRKPSLSVPRSRVATAFSAAGVLMRRGQGGTLSLMPDTLDLRLDPETERALLLRIDEETQRGRFTLSHGSTLVLTSGQDPSHGELVSKLKDKLERYVDFESGGLKLIEIEKNGARARFTLVPSWETAPHGVRGNKFGGPSIALRFTMTW